MDFLQASEQSVGDSESSVFLDHCKCTVVNHFESSDNKNTDCGFVSQNQAKIQMINSLKFKRKGIRESEVEFEEAIQTLAVL